MIQDTGVNDGVSIRDVQRALGMSSNDLGTLCKSSLVNKWAKYKPVKFKPVIGIKVDIMTAQNWIDANYGIANIPTWSRLDYASTFLFSDSRGSLEEHFWPECDREKGLLSLEYFSHNLPNGGSSGPYRLTDFNNYFKNAEQPIGPMQEASIKIEPSGKLRVRFQTGAQSDYTLKLSDLKWPDSSNYTIGNMYFGILMKQISGSLTTRTYVATQKGDTDIKMSEAESYGGFWVDFSHNIVTAEFTGTWKIYPIISSSPISETTSISQQTVKIIAPLPYHDQAINISIQFAEILITDAHGYKDSLSEGRYARFSFSLKNEEPEGAYRNYRIDVVLCNSNGEVIQTGWSGGSATGQISTGTTSSVNVNAYIAQIYSSVIYFKAELTIEDDVEFKRVSYWTLTGPISEQQPTPDD